jgi:HAD superfamily hydrolase (TIGR01549 family)
MARVEVVCFDVGYTLIDETRSWLVWARRLGVATESLYTALRESIERGEDHFRALQRLRPDLDLESERPSGRAASSFLVGDIYAESQPTLERLKAMGYRLGAAGNMRADTESVLAESELPLEFIGSSERWGVKKPAPEFFAQVIQAGGSAADRTVYVGDRVDNDILPAQAAGMRAVFVRRGLWGMAHAARPDSARADATIATLAELPGVLERWRQSG